MAAMLMVVGTASDIEVGCFRVKVNHPERNTAGLLMVGKSLTAFGVDMEEDIEWIDEISDSESNCWLDTQGRM